MEPMESKAIALFDRLSKLDHVQNPTRVMIIIGDGNQAVRYYGVRIIENLVADKTCRNPGPYQRESIWLVGDRPQPKRKTVYHLPQDAREWYLSCYIEQSKNPTPDELEKYRQFSPEGSQFAIAPWQVPDGEIIDRWEEFVYDRRKLRLFTLQDDKWVEVPHDPATKYPVVDPTRRPR